MGCIVALFLLIVSFSGSWTSSRNVAEEIAVTSTVEDSSTHNTMASGATTAVLSRMRNLRVVYVTAPSKDAALKIARAAVERKLAACVNIIPGITSVYEWQGKLHEDSEAVLIMKTQENLLEDLHKVVIENHSYEVPAFVSLPIDGVSQPYADWLLGQTKQSGNSEL